MSLTIDAFTLGLLAAICLAIGFLVALLINNLREGQGEGEPASEEQAPDQEPMDEIFRLLRREDGSVIPQVGGERIHEASDLNAEDHGLLSLGLVDLYAWLESGHRPAPKVKTRKRRRKKAEEEEAVAAEAPDEEVVEEGQPEVAEQEEEEAAEAAEAARSASLNPLKSLVRTAQSEINEKIPEEAPSIARQVDEILQTRLEGTPLEDRAIRLLDLPNQGMVILVGLDKYLGIDEVPDEEIRSILKSAVEEWEARMLKGSRRGSLR